MMHPDAIPQPSAIPTWDVHDDTPPTCEQCGNEADCTCPLCTATEPIDVLCAACCAALESGAA